MSDTQHLLSDDQMTEFLSRGCLVLQNDAPAELHQAILHKVDAAIQAEGNPGNNLLARVPEIQELFNR
ncbi:MAG TPA: phytanoyl-CoA dioxygenase, partial [Limnochordia bacterium]|nr:phytanoyl-CoA dioxygenase [Limnochordia bacterium]